MSLIGPSDDLLVVADRVYRDAYDHHPAQAVLVRGGRIETVGGADQVAADMARLEVPGGTVLPGFVDDHVHLLHTGMTRFAIRLDQATSRSEVAELLEEAEEPFVMATGLDEYRLARAEFPDGPWLDDLLGGRPVVLKGITGHYAVANRSALELLGVPPDVPGQEEGGYLRAEANSLVSRLARERFVAEIGPERVFQAGSEVGVANGVTTVHALEGWDAPDPIELRWLMDLQGSLPLRTIVWAQTTHIPTVLEYGLPRIGGDISLDGDFGPRTALVREPYADGTGLGNRYYEPAFLRSFAEEAAGEGLQIAFHCVGDGAAQLALDTYRHALERHPDPDHRHRIEHFEVGAEDLIERTAELGVAVSLQPPFDGYFGGQERSLVWAGPERVESVDAIRSFLEAGIRCGGGSDSPVTPLDPILGLHCCVEHSNPAESIDIRSAIHLYTRGSAELAFLENTIGSIRPGMAGDLVVLDRDPFDVPTDQVGELRVLATVVGGRVVHRADA